MFDPCFGHAVNLDTQSTFLDMPLQQELTNTVEGMSIHRDFASTQAVLCLVRSTLWKGKVPSRAPRTGSPTTCNPFSLGKRSFKHSTLITLKISHGLIPHLRFHLMKTWIMGYTMKFSLNDQDCSKLFLDTIHPDIKQSTSYLM